MASNPDDAAATPIDDSPRTSNWATFGFARMAWFESLLLVINVTVANV